MNRSEQINELAAALAKFHKEVSNPTKNATNPHFRSQYADLAEVINVSREPLAAAGLSILQMICLDDKYVTIETIMLHVSGQFISSVLSVPVSKMDAQGVGSAATYGRRYSWAAMCGLAQQDDDANSAVGKSQDQPHQDQQRKSTAVIEKTPYTLERAKSMVTGWQENKMNPATLLTGIKSKHTIDADVEKYITESLEGG